MGDDLLDVAERYLDEVGDALVVPARFVMADNAAAGEWVKSHGGVASVALDVVSSVRQVSRGSMDYRGCLDCLCQDTDWDHAISSANGPPLVTWGGVH